MKLLAHANRNMPFSEHCMYFLTVPLLCVGQPGKGHPDFTIKTPPLKIKIKTPSKVMFIWLICVRLEENLKAVPMLRATTQLISLI